MSEVQEMIDTIKNRVKFKVNKVINPTNFVPEVRINAQMNLEDVQDLINLTSADEAIKFLGEAVIEGIKNAGFDADNL